MFKKSADTPDTVRNDVMDLREKVHKLAMEMAELASAFKTIAGEWSTAYDKIMRADARFRARQQRAEENPNTEPADAPDIPAIDQVSARVLARRNHGISG